MYVQVKEQSLVIYIFKGLNYMNIGPRNGVVKTPDRVTLRSDENDKKSVLGVCNLNLAAEM